MMLSCKGDDMKKFKVNTTVMDNGDIVLTVDYAKKGDKECYTEQWDKDIYDDIMDTETCKEYCEKSLKSGDVTMFINNTKLNIDKGLGYCSLKLGNINCIKE